MDVYSFGLIMWELYHESIPFDDDLEACYELVVKMNRRPRIQNDTEKDKEACSKPIQDLIRLCWTADPASRPTFKEILAVLVLERTFFARASEIYHECRDSSDVEPLLLLRS